MSPNASFTVHLKPTPITHRRFYLPHAHSNNVVVGIQTRRRISRNNDDDDNKLVEFTRMGSEAVVAPTTRRKPRFLCLHGFRTSGLILKTQLNKWPESVLRNFDMDFLDGPFPAQGKSEVDGIFDPPYHEWFQFNKEFSEYTNFDECLEFIEDYMIKNGPFDGLLGFSQGAILSGALPGLQAKGLALTKVPKIKLLIIIGGAKFCSPKVAEHAYSSPIQIRSLHFLGETDFLKPYGLELLKNCVEPMVIHHPKGHTIPRLDEKGLETIMSFIETIQKKLEEKEEMNSIKEA